MWETCLILFFCLVCLLWGCGFYTLLIRSSLTEKLQEKSRHALGIVFLSIYIISFIEVKPWHDVFVATGTEPHWSPLISGADLFTYLGNSVNTKLLWIPMYIYGPIYYLKIFSSSFLFSMLFLLGCELILFWQWRKVDSKHSWIYLLLMLSNPWVLIQFTSVSKEIFILLTLFSFLIYQEGNNKFLLLVSIVFAFFSRIEFLIAYCAFLIVRKVRFISRKWQLVILIALVSIFYSFIPGSSAKIAILEMDQETARFGVTSFLNKLCSEYFLFPLTVIPRTILTIFEKTKGYIFSGNEVESYLNLIIDVSSEWIFFLTLAVALAKKKIYDLKIDSNYFFWIFIIMVSTVPYPVFRYIVPAYLLILRMI